MEAYEMIPRRLQYGVVEAAFALGVVDVAPQVPCLQLLTPRRHFAAVVVEGNVVMPSALRLTKDLNPPNSCLRLPRRRLGQVPFFPPAEVWRETWNHVAWGLRRRSCQWVPTYLRRIPEAGNHHGSERVPGSDWVWAECDPASVEM